MKISVSAKQLTLSDDLRLYAEKKVGKIDRLFRNDSEAAVSFSRERGRFTVEVTVNNNGMYYRAKETTGDVFASVDSAVASIERQIRKNKTRLEKRLRSGAFERAVAEAPAESDELVRRKQFELRPMSEQDALLQMDLLNHEFYVFKNSDAANAVCVCYKRRDGGYGIIETV